MQTGLRAVPDPTWLPIRLRSDKHTESSEPSIQALEETPQTSTARSSGRGRALAGEEAVLATPSGTLGLTLGGLSGDPRGYWPGVGVDAGGKADSRGH